jgi:hypothetical protein
MVVQTATQLTAKNPLHCFGTPRHRKNALANINSGNHQPSDLHATMCTEKKSCGTITVSNKQNSQKWKNTQETIIM